MDLKKAILIIIFSLLAFGIAYFIDNYYIEGRGTEFLLEVFYLK